MSVRTSKHSRSARMQPDVVSQTKVSLQNLPEKKKEFLPLQEAIHQLRAPLKAALIKGYSYQELAAMLQQQGISISESTLKNYLSSNRQKTSKSRVSSKRRRDKSFENPLEKPGTTVEVFIPAKTKMSSYTVGRDFWNAYQESLREREEVYRRLAES